MTERMLINGEWVSAKNGGMWSLVDPGTQQEIDKIPFGTAEDAQAALDAAADAFPAWAAKSVFERCAILEKAADLLTSRIDEYAKRTTEESGKPFVQARGEWAGAPLYLRGAAEDAKHLGGRWIPSRAVSRRIDVTYAPLGVVAAITAWNFPIYNVNRAVASALAVGNTMVVRPSEFTPRSAFDYARALTDAGLPKGVLNVVNGDPHGMGQAFLDDPRCRKIAFTGSTRVGKLLMDGASRTVTRLSLELGGNAPVLVFPDSDIAAVVKSGVTAKLRNAGQVCIAPQRFYVHASVMGEFLAAAAKAVDAEVIGHGLDPKTTLGPLINEKQRDRVADVVHRSLAKGGQAICGRTIPNPGFFYTPTVLHGISEDAPILHEEAFGPILPVVPFHSTEQAIALANATEYGLAAYVWTKDLNTAIKVSEALEFGMVGINDWYPVTPEAPFGGVKQSGMGRESGLEGVHEYVDVKTRYFGGLG